MRKLMRAIAAVVSLLPATAQSNGGAVLSDQTMRELSAKGTLIRYFQNQDALRLLPKAGLAADLAADVKDFGPTVAVEVLRLIPDAPPAPSGASGKLMLLNALCSVSTMKGITYWSRSRNKDWVLFRESYAIASPQNTARIPDPAFSSVPAESEFYSFQEDSTFGKNIYQTSVTDGADCLRVRTLNVSPISFLFITVIPSGSLVTHTLIVPTENALVFYGAALLRSSFPLGDKQARSESLASRLIAMADWLKVRLGL
jgi:hypothetical protein